MIAERWFTATGSAGSRSPQTSLAPPRGVRTSKAAVADLEGGRGRLVRLAVVHAVRRARAAVPDSRGMKPAAARAVVRVAGNPADFSAPEPNRDIRTASLSLIGEFLAKDHMFRCYVQTGWIIAVWAGDVSLPDEATMRARIDHVSHLLTPTTPSRSQWPRSWVSSDVETWAPAHPGIDVRSSGASH